jgi:hypothetical protein
MMSFKQFSVSVLAVAAAVAASSASAAVTQPVTATSAAIAFDTTYLAANNITIAALGSATVNTTTGIGTLPLGSVSLASTATGPITATFASGAGVSLAVKSATTGLTTTVKLTNFVFDVATSELSANVTSGILLNLPAQSLLTAGVVGGDFGGAQLSTVANSTTTRSLNLYAANFALSESFKTLMADNGLDANSFSFVASVVKNIKVGSVPEPSTYALMGLGLVGMAFVARRKQQA